MLTLGTNSKSGWAVPVRAVQAVMAGRQAVKVAAAVIMGTTEEVAEELLPFKA
jgi:hypothetical protein